MCEMCTGSPASLPIVMTSSIASSKPVPSLRMWLA